MSPDPAIGNRSLVQESPHERDLYAEITSELGDANHRLADSRPRVRFFRSGVGVACSTLAPLVVRPSALNGLLLSPAW